MELDVEALKQIMEGWETPAWLSLGFSEATLIGRAARLGAAAAVNPQGRLFEIVSGAIDTPNKRASAWAKELKTNAVEEIRESFEGGCDILVADLEDRPFESPALGDLHGIVARSICQRRDDIESLAWVLREVGLDVDEELARVDESAKSQIPAVEAALKELPVELHLSSVGWQCPEAWWGLR